MKIEQAYYNLRHGKPKVYILRSMIYSITAKMLEKVFNEN